MIKLKNVVISADGDRKVYSVPNVVADNLEEYCNEFCCVWLVNSPDAKMYRKKGCLMYNEEDFIDYINKYKFPNELSTFVENLGWIDFDSPLPEKYKDCPEFNF